MEKGGGQRAPPEGAQSPAALEPVEDVPDPEEDDLDDLDGTTRTILENLGSLPTF